MHKNKLNTGCYFVSYHSNYLAEDLVANNTNAGHDRDVVNGVMDGLLPGR